MKHLFFNLDYVTWDAHVCRCHALEMRSTCAQDDVQNPRSTRTRKSIDGLSMDSTL